MTSRAPVADDPLLALLRAHDPLADATRSTDIESDALWTRITAITDAPPRVERHLPFVPGRHARRVGVRVALVALCLIAATTAALAATGVWTPMLGGPGAAAPSTSKTPIPTAAVTTLGVLRRPQTAADRSRATESLLRAIGPEGAGVRLSSIRLVTLADGQHAVIYSQQKGINPVTGATQSFEPICILIPPDAWSCASLAAIRAHGLLVGVFGVEGHAVGVVPDGVATVRLTYPDGITHHVPVTENLYTDEPRAAVTPAPSTSDRSPTRPPPPPALPSRVQWLDADNTTIGPPG